MAYATGLRKDRIIVLNRTVATQGRFGLDASGIEWTQTVELWASVTWAKGNRALNAGSIDAYSVVNVRMLWSPDINMRSRIIYDSQTYQILPETFHADKMENTIQFLAQVLVNEGTVYSSSDLGAGSSCAI